MNDYVTELETELLSAARRRRHRALAAPIPLPRFPRPSTLVPTLTVAGALAIAALALVLVGTRSHTRAAATQHPASHGLATVPAAARRLVREFAVLRGPETAADRAFAATFPPAAYRRELSWHAVPGLTRLLARLPGGERLYLQVVAFRRPHMPGTVVGATLVFAGHNSVSGELVISGKRQWLAGARPIRWGDEWVQLVPDRVTHILWRFANGLTVAPHVSHNLAVAAFARGERAPRGNAALRVTGERSLRHLFATVVSRAPVAHLSATHLDPGAHGLAGFTNPVHGRRGIVITARDVPAETRGKGAYAIWLCPVASTEGCELAGFPSKLVDPNRRLVTSGWLPNAVASRERRIIVALQRTKQPTRPGRVVLTGLAPAGTL